MKNVEDMVAAANAEVESLSAEEAIALHGADGVTFVDIRDVRELWRDGAVPGAFHCPRGMLEFWIDPESEYAKPQFAAPHRFVFFCAGGKRSALAAKTAQDMGLRPVAHVDSGFRGWQEAGGPVVKKERRR